MMRDYFDDYGEPTNRKAAVQRHLSRLRLDPAEESPAIAERKAREAKERLERQDKLFGNYPGASIADIYKLPKNVSVGDPDADALDDADRELASLDEARR